MLGTDTMEINPTERKEMENEQLELDPMEQEDLEEVGWFDLGGRR